MTRGVLPKPPRFLTIEEVLSLHQAAIDAHGGSHGVRDRGLLESAIAMPQQGFGGTYSHEMPFAMAAAYLFHICKNHPFVDGNKRTALATALAFLHLNGWTLPVSEDDVVQCVLDVATGVISKESLVEWIEVRARPRSSIELRDFFQEINYQALGAKFRAISVGGRDEQVASILEAGAAIPSVNQASIGAVHADEGGNIEAATILRQHAMLLTALYRIAEDMGYEW